MCTMTLNPSLWGLTSLIGIKTDHTTFLSDPNQGPLTMSSGPIFSSPEASCSKTWQVRPFCRSRCVSVVMGLYAVLRCWYLAGRGGAKRVAELGALIQW